MNDSDDSTPQPILPNPEYPSWQSAVMVLTMTLGWMLIVYILLAKAGLSKPVTLTLSEIGMFIPALLWSFYTHFKFSKIFRFQYPGWKHLLLAIPLGIGMSVMIDAIDRWWSLVIPPNPAYAKEMMESLHTTTSIEFVIVALGVALFAPLTEEMLFRGLFQGALESRVSSASAIFWTAAVFSLFHGNLPQLLSLVLLSLMLGFVVWRVDSILPSVIIHSVNNSIALATIDCPDGELFHGYLQGHFVAWQWFGAALALTLVSGFGYFRFTRQESSEQPV